MLGNIHYQRTIRAMTIKLAAKRLTTLGLLGLAGLSLPACVDDTLTEAPPHVIVADNLYRNVAGFEAGLNALYSQVRGERLGYADRVNSPRNMVMTVGVDNAFVNYEDPASRIFNNFGTLSHPLETDYLDVWSWLYRIINAANTIVDRAENPEVRWSEAEKNRVVAEARLFRAWAYRHLTYLWGDVPLNLKESSGESVRTDWERTPRSEVRKQMEADLLFAEQHLPPASANPGKLTQAVAQHYLAEIYLAMDRPADAVAKAQAVVGSGLYSLVTERYGTRATEPGVPFMDQFQDGNVNRNQGNTEVLWALQYQMEVAGGGESIMRRWWVNRYYNIRGVAVSAENGGRGIGRLSPTKWAIDLYEPQDDRGSIHAIRKFYLYNTTSRLPSGKSIGDTVYLKWAAEKKSNPNWPSTRKWDWADPLNVDGGTQYGDQPYIRLAETYLLLAEAQFKQGNLGGAAATLNILRRRANASEIGAGQVTLDFILDERSRELLSEEHRRYTLVRTGTFIDRVMRYNPIAAPNITPRDTVLPIPQAVIDANLDRAMEQNPGY